MNWLDELTFGPGPPWHHMGTRGLDQSPWVTPVPPERRSLKESLLRDVHEVVSASPSSPPAVAAASAVAGAVGLVLQPDRPPLEAAALIVDEDLCVLTPGSGTWRLVAGVVCFPSVWNLPDKLGLPVSEVHGPVPAYDVELADRVSRFLDRLSPERPVWRRNWTVHATPELYLPAPVRLASLAAPPRVPDDLWVRSERQSLVRLPDRPVIVFTIRTQLTPLTVLAERPDVARRMADTVRAWPAEIVAYRSMGSWRDELVKWLESAT